MRRRGFAFVCAAVTFVCVLRFWPEPEAAPASPVPVRPFQLPSERAAAAEDAPAAPPAPAVPLPKGTSRIEGSVSDERGARVGNTTVSVRPIGEFMNAARPGQTDAQGLFVFDELPAGDWEIVARVPRAFEVSAVVAVQPGATARADLVHPKLGSITGTLRDGDGQPLGSERVAASCGGRYRQRAFTDERGRFELEALPLGASCRVAAAGPAWVKTPVTAAVTSPPADITVTTRRLAVVRGRAVDEAGHPIERLIISDGPRLVFEDGVFEAPALARPLVLVSEGRVAVPLPPAAPDGPDVDAGTLVFRPGRTVVGRATDAEGRPLVRVIFMNGPKRVGFTVGGGDFHLVDIPLEDVELTVSHYGHQTRRVRVPAGATRLDVALQRGETVRGHVTWHEGMAPVPLVVQGAGRWVNVDAKGDFVLAGLDPGPLRIYFVAQAGEVYAPPATLEVVAGVQGVVDALVLPRDGRAVLLFEKPFAEVPAVTVEVDGQPLQVQPSWNGALTECRLSRLPPGRVKVTAEGRPPAVLDVSSGQIARVKLSD